MTILIETQVRRQLVDASLTGGCGCEPCRAKREQEAALGAFQLMYPELPFIPDRFAERFMAWKLPRHNIETIRAIQSRNEFRELEEQEKDKPKPLHFCRQCGLLVLAKDSKPIGEHRYCNQCLLDLRLCHHCGLMHRQRDCYNAVGPDNNVFHICMSCRHHYQKCYNCNVLIPIKYRFSIPYSRNDVGEKNFRVLCATCVQTQQQKCYGCGGVTYAGVSTIRGGYSFCPSCLEESAGIANYNYKPLIPRFRKAKTEGKVTHKAFHMGFELEVAEHHSLNDHQTVVHMVKEYVGRKNIYAMSDGSISGATGTNGAEFASHPFTWEYYKDKGHIHWDKLCLKLREFGWKGNTPGLGIHIHTTKAAWGTHQIYKLLKFINTNKIQIQKVSQRGPTVYNNYDYMGHDNIGIIAKEKKQNGGHGHYQCVNLNQGETGLASKTIEFRMFQSTLEPLFFHKNIEFVYALWKFTQECSLKQMGWKAFIQWLWASKREYPCLVEFINWKGIK